MFVILAIIIGLIIGFIRGGKFAGFKAKKISLLPLGIIGIVLQLALHLYFYSGGISAIEPFLPVVNFVSYILILVMLVFNLDDFWTIMMSVGLTSNFIVAFINGGKMPVTSSIIEAVSGTAFGTTVIEGTNAVYSVIVPSTTSLWFLGVNIPIPYIGKITAYLGSVGGLGVGGIVTVIGLIGFVQYAMNRIPADSIFNVDEPIGEKDYILPPDETEEDFFSDNDADDDFYSEDDFEEDPIGTIENSFGGMTGKIPKLTPEAIAKIQDGKVEALGVSVLDEYDSTQDTKVFTVINDLGAHTPSPQEDHKEETSAVSGFFAQSFYAEKEKGKLAFEKEQAVEIVEEIEKEAEEKILEQRIIIETPVADLDIPAFVEDETPFVVENDKIISNPAFENNMIEMKKEERTEDDMLNIWQQVNQENERVRSKKRRSARYIDTKEPFKAEREREAATRAVERATEVAKARATASPRPVSYSDVKSKVQKTEMPVSESIRTEIQRPQKATVQETCVIPNVVQSEEPIKSSARTNVGISDGEREKAGFERVSFSVEGKDVVFWKKKKD